MTFLWPTLLVLLAVLPVLVAIRIWGLRRRRSGVRFSSLSLVRVAAPGSSWIRRHLPFALFVLGLGSLVLAMARPAAIVPVASSRTTVVLAMDVSRSMCATDIPPNRLVAAEEAASSFVENQDSGTQIGIVAFAGFAEIVQVPTNDEEVLLDVIASLATGRRTAVGSAILEAIDAIAEIDPSIAASIDEIDPGASAPPSVPGRRLCAGDHRPAHRRRQQCRPGAGRGRAAGGRSRTCGSSRSGSGRRIPAAGRRAAGRSTSATSPATTARKGSTRGSAAADSAGVAAGSAGRSTRRR